MKQQLLFDNNLKEKPNQRGNTQARVANLSGIEEVINTVAKEKWISLHTNDLVKLFDCPDFVFKGWSFYEDSVYRLALFPEI
jgi:hypothetical protein